MRGEKLIFREYENDLMMEEEEVIVTPVEEEELPSRRRRRRRSTYKPLVLPAGYAEVSTERELEESESSESSLVEYELGMEEEPGARCEEDDNSVV